MCTQLSIIVIVIVIILLMRPDDYSCQQLQQQVQFLPVNNWNCNEDTEKLCAVDAASQMLQTSSLTECSLHCALEPRHCLQFNYYSSPMTSPAGSSLNCHFYDSHPARYNVTAGCQHYVMSPDLPRNCADHRSNGHTEDKVYTIFINTAPTTVRDIYCYMSAAPWTTIARDCADILAAGQMNSGLYTVRVNDRDIEVYCDMTTAAGGWLVFQRRKDGSEDFYRDWQQYSDGFGDLDSEFWLGNENLHLLTTGSPARMYELRVDLGDFDGQTRFAEYSDFSIWSAADKYRLNLGSYTNGDDGDSLTAHKGMMFSTRDEDNDLSGGQQCAVKYGGAWWYSACHASNLNGRYLGGPHSSEAQGIIWYHWRQHYYSLRFTEMKIRPTGLVASP